MNFACAQRNVHREFKDGLPVNLNHLKDYRAVVKVWREKIENRTTAEGNCRCAKVMTKNVATDTPLWLQTTTVPVEIEKEVIIIDATVWTAAARKAAADEAQRKKKQ